MSLPILDVTSNGTGSGATVTVAHTVTNSQSNLILIVIVENNDTSDPTVTYAGVAMTKLTSVAIGSSPRLAFFYKLNPATGNNNIVVSQGSTITAIVDGISYYNVAQSSTFGTPATASGTTGNSSTTVTTTSTNQLVVDCIDSSPGSTFTQPNGETVEVSQLTNGFEAIGDIPATGSNMTLSWNLNSGSIAWLQISVAMNGVASSGPKRFITSMDPFMSPGYIPGVTQ